jgi:ribosome-associated protein
MDDLDIGSGVVIPDRELVWSFSTSGGPGGQHANRSATRAEVRFDLGASPSVPTDLKERMLSRLGGRASSGVVVVTADESRSQWRNRQSARRRLSELLFDATKLPKIRRATRPSMSAKKRRIESKRHRSGIKQMRRPPEPDERGS